jgi:ATP-dependent Clp protease protease subunit
MGLYDEKKQAEEKTPQITEDNSKMYDEINYALNIEDSVIYLSGEIDEFTVHDLIAKFRIVLNNRPENSKEPINLIIDSHGGCAYSMFGVIDYIESLDVKVNTVCRGRAMSAAALILSSGTGKRVASKRSTIMLHEGSSVQVGKYSDLKVASKQADKMENMVRVLLAEKTKKDADWWAENTKTDLWLTAEEALDLGLIDSIG